MRLPFGLRLTLGGFTALVLVVIYTPLLLVLLNSFNADRTFGWPPKKLTLHWWDVAAHSEGARAALWTSVQVALLATAIAWCSAPWPRWRCGVPASSGAT